MSKWRAKEHVREHANYNIEFRAYFNESSDSFISRLDVRSTQLETTLIVQPSGADVRTRLKDVFAANGFTVEPNALDYDQAVRVIFKNSNLQQEKVKELVTLLISQDPSVFELQTRLLSDLNQSLCFGTLGLGINQASRYHSRMFHGYSKSASTSAQDYSQTNDTRFGKTQ